MKNGIIIFIVVFGLVLGPRGWAMDHAKEHAGEHAAEASDHSHHQHGEDPAHSGNGQGGGQHTFTHTMQVDGIHSEFQVMSLASMNMKDPEGNTHHIMAKFSHQPDGEKLKDVIGKIKVIAPSGAEQINTLKDYGGILAANFTFAEKGRYGVICLARIEGQKPVFKFWYPHE